MHINITFKQPKPKIQDIYAPESETSVRRRTARRLFILLLVPLFILVLIGIYGYGVQQGFTLDNQTMSLFSVLGAGGGGFLLGIIISIPSLDPRFKLTEKGYMFDEDVVESVKLKNYEKGN